MAYFLSLWDLIRRSWGMSGAACNWGADDDLQMELLRGAILQADDRSRIRDERDRNDVSGRCRNPHHPRFDDLRPAAHGAFQVGH